MRIGGLQKTSLLDYQDTISAIIWTVGCNFRCPFCYNKELVLEKIKIISEEEVFSFLKNRKSMLEGVSISGGEPLFQEDISNFILKIKELGYKVKIDTNGAYPEKLKDLVERKLIDYVAMDVKAPKEKYNILVGMKTDISKIEESIELIKNCNINYEFKTTFVPDLLNKEDIVKIAKWLKGAKNFFLQQFIPEQSLILSSLEDKVPYRYEYLLETLNEIKPNFKRCEIRGIK